MTDGPGRIVQLAGRVRWLDRYRRVVGILVGLICALLVALQIDSDWPRVHTVALLIATTFVMWLLTEIALAYVTALWETECDQLTRDRGLPCAIVRK